MDSGNVSSVQIIPYYSHPHVHGVINDNTFYDETVQDVSGRDVLPYSTMIMSGADSGIDNTFVRLTSLDVKRSVFGNGNFQKYGQPSLQADVLFNGHTNVWFCRALPDNALVSNIIFLAHYRKGKILDDLGQETGKSRLEIKFSKVYASKPYITDGAKNDDDIKAYARSLIKTSPDPKTGYMTVPIAYVRSIGRGQYGNSYSVSVTRDVDAEKEYGVKMYKFNLINNKDITTIYKQFSGSLYQTVKQGVSTLIDDVLDQYPTGSCPIKIYSFEDEYNRIFDFYHNTILPLNRKYVQQSGGTQEDIDELKAAEKITAETFDPLFGFEIDTRTNDSIPYYRNYTIKEEGAWVVPDLEVPNTVGATKPLNIASWSTAKVGAKVLVAADPLNDGYRWLYTVTHIDPVSGNIIYDDGVETSIDDDQYDGINISQNVGHMLDGGHDGDFQEITVDGETRTPTSAEMKLLLSREFVKIARGLKDRRILSPARIDLDFIFDANYNMTSTETLTMQSNTTPLYNSSTILTDSDAQQLAILGGTDFTISFSDLNVKKALFDLNTFRNKNGMVINPEDGAGCSLYLDCGLVGLKNIGVNYELINIIDMMEPYATRATSIDIGYYQIYDPYTSRKIDVTVDYMIAQKLIPHLIKHGMNKPFVNNYAQLNSVQRDSELQVTGDFIRDTFRPDFDIIDWDVKEKLYKARINYWITSDEGRVVQRAVQNTRQVKASVCLEENNVRVLNKLKKNLDKSCRSYLYEWNDPAARKGYTKAQEEIYRPWIGTIVEDLRIYFDANEWEQERMIMHCYCEVKFRDIIKRIILEINISRPDYSGGEN